MNRIAHILATALLAGAAAAHAQGVAFITDLKGDVTIEGNQRPLVLAELTRGQKLTLGADGRAAIMYIATGKEYALKGPGEYLVKDTEVTNAAGAAAAARTTEWRASSAVLAQVAQTSNASVRMRSLAKPRVEPGPVLVYPTQGNVSTLQPTFRWNSMDARTPGEITLNVDGQDKPVHRAKTTGAAYKMPARLKPATDYQWKVSVGSEELGTGRFRTLPADAIRTIDARRPAARAEFSDRLMFALLLQEMGATQEARELWSSLSQERADLPELSALTK